MGYKAKEVIGDKWEHGIDTAGKAKERVSEIGTKAKEVIGGKLNGAAHDRSASEDRRQREGETTHEYNLRLKKIPVKHYDADTGLVQETEEIHAVEHERAR